MYLSFRGSQRLGQCDLLTLYVVFLKYNLLDSLYVGHMSDQDTGEDFCTLNNVKLKETGELFPSSFTVHMGIE